MCIPKNFWERACVYLLSEFYLIRFAKLWLNDHTNVLSMTQLFSKDIIHLCSDKLFSTLAMDILREKEFRDVFSMILKFKNMREPLLKMSLNSRGWSQKALKNSS